MHAALWQLLWFDARGSLRGLMNIRRNWRQLVLFVLMLGFIGLFIGVRVFSSREDPSGRFGSGMPFWALIYLLATWLTAAADRGLVMRPAEIHFVAGGPFRERDVITLNLIRLAFRALISASVLSLIALAYVDSYLSALVGMWLLITVSLLVGMLASLSSRQSHGPLVQRLRRLFTAAAIGALLMLIVQSMDIVKAAGEVPRVDMIASAATETPLGRVLLPPLAWMFAPLSANSFLPETLALLPSRMAVVVGLVALVYLLGGRYLEASTRRTDVSIAKRQTAQRSGVASGTSGGNWARRLRVPLLGRWGGIGSVAWMQVVHSLRILPRFLVFTLTIVGVVLVIPLMLDPQRLSGWGAVWMAALIGYADFLLLLQLPVGFLGPASQRELLKSLPIPAWRVAVGQLAGPVVPLATLHLALTLLFVFLVPNETRSIMETSIALLPAGLVLIANVNLLGSWNIIRPRALQQRDALAAGRAMASVWIFLFMLTPAIVISTISAVLVNALIVPGETGYRIGAAMGAVLSSPIYIVLLARSFSNWQPSAAEGGEEETEYNR